MSEELAAGQLRTWKQKYFTHTPPTSGYEFFMLIEPFLENSVKKWHVMFCGGSLVVMSEDSILNLSRSMLERNQ